MSDKAKQRLDSAAALFAHSREYPDMSLPDRLTAVGRQTGYGFEYMSQTFWELVRLGYYDSHGKLRRKDETL